MDNPSRRHQYACKSAAEGAKGVYNDSFHTELKWLEIQVCFLGT